MSVCKHNAFIGVAWHSCVFVASISCVCMRAVKVIRAMCDVWLIPVREIVGGLPGGVGQAMAPKKAPGRHPDAP